MTTQKQKRLELSQFFKGVAAGVEGKATPVYRR
jgi:hypothetical protein